MKSPMLGKGVPTVEGKYGAKELVEDDDGGFGSASLDSKLT